MQGPYLAVNSRLALFTGEIVRSSVGVWGMSLIAVRWDWLTTHFRSFKCCLFALNSMVDLLPVEYKWSCSNIDI
jgi:hypothetical protein